MNIRFAICVIACGLLVGLTGCQKQSDTIKKNILLQAKLGNPKHFDIPLPITFVATAADVKRINNESRDTLTYHGTLSTDQTIAFYVREMEQSGWELEDLSSNHEGILFGRKPGKRCGITIRHISDASKPTVLTIFVVETNQ